jgi:flavin-dependent dehydrogenase
VLLEKEVHPRFHIGESLRPRNLAVLDRLGMGEEVAAMGVLKPGAEFVSDITGESVAFPFAHSLNRADTHAYQVRRAEFDAALFANARRRGARAMERVRVTSVAFGGERAAVTAKDASGETLSFAPRFVLDASGRDTFMSGRLGTKRANKQNNTAAVFAHFSGVEARTGETRGYISVHLAENGWFWMIPLPGEVMSVGFVGNQEAFKQRGGTLADLLAEKIAGSPSVRARMRDATRLSDVYSAGNYSYRADTAWGDGWMMIGDAFAFLDPVFSSGVLLAMTSAERGAEVADAWLEEPARARALARRMERDMRQAMARIAWLIYRINTPALRSLFMAPRNTLGMRDGLISLLAGNIRGNWRMALPVAAFKTIYHIVSLKQRLDLLIARREPAAVAAE